MTSLHLILPIFVLGPKAMPRLELSLALHFPMCISNKSYTASRLNTCGNPCATSSKNTLLNKLAARRNFYTATIAPDESISTFSSRVRQLAATLRSMGVILEESEMAMALLNGLPERFDGLISALDALGNDDKIFTFDFIKSRCVQEEQRHS
eukprot:IDg3752t1